MRASSLLLPFLATCLLTCKVEAFVISKESGSRASFIHPIGSRARPDITTSLGAARNKKNLEDESSSSHLEDNTNTKSSRRELLVAMPGLALPLFLSSQPSLAEEEDRNNKPAKILVLGKGFVGSLVVDTLADMGIETIATTRNGRDGTVALDFTQDDVAKKVERLASGCTAVISCVGAIGTKNDKTVNEGTGIAAQAAKRAGVERFVYITVAPEIMEFGRDVDFLNEYMTGKISSRDAVLREFKDKAVLIEPTFIYGGGSFELNPPRVAKAYGKLVEGILTSSPARNVERLLSPGFIKIALEPPVPVEDVANAAVAGALGETLPVLDTYDKIKKASSQLE